MHRGGVRKENEEKKVINYGKLLDKDGNLMNFIDHLINFNVFVNYNNLNPIWLLI